MTKISLVMPTLNAGPLLEEVLAAVDAQPRAGELERVAIDSGSTDGTRDVLARHGFDVTVIDKREFSHGATRDAAIRKTSGEVVVLLTQDATPADERWLDRLVACYEDDSVGAAYCKQIPRADCNPFIARRLREWTAGKSERVVQAAVDAEAFDALEPMQRLERCAYDNVAGSVRRSAWEQHEFGRHPFGEDVAFGKKLILSGWNIVFEPEASVIHSHNRSPRAEGKRIYCDHDNLRGLFGVHLLPTWEAYHGAVEWGRKTYSEEVDSLELNEPERTELHAWARDYAHWGALGMFLGANARDNLDGPDAALYRQIDRTMRAGI